MSLLYPGGCRAAGRARYAASEGHHGPAAGAMQCHTTTSTHNLHALHTQRERERERERGRERGGGVWCGARDLPALRVYSTASDGREGGREGGGKGGSGEEEGRGGRGTGGGGRGGASERASERASETQTDRQTDMVARLALGAQRLSH